MLETTEKRTLVELVLKNFGVEFPEFCIASNGEIAKNPRILSGVTFIKYPGGAFRSSSGRDFREDAIIENAPSNANSYLGGGVLPERGVLCGDNYSAIVYFHIDEEQVRNAPILRRIKRNYVEDIPDGEAD